MIHATDNPLPSFWQQSEEREREKKICPTERISPTENLAHLGGIFSSQSSKVSLRKGRRPSQSEKEADLIDVPPREIRAKVFGRSQERAQR